MEVLKKVIGIVLILIAAIVAIHTVIEPLYHTSTVDNLNSPIWGYITVVWTISICFMLCFQVLLIFH